MSTWYTGGGSFSVTISNFIVHRTLGDAGIVEHPSI